MIVTIIKCITNDDTTMRAVTVNQIKDAIFDNTVIMINNDKMH